MSTMRDRARALELQVAKPEPIEPARAPLDYDDGLLAVAGPIMAGAYAIALAAAASAFRHSTEAVFAVLISVGFAVVYFAVPMLMLRMRREHDGRFSGTQPGSLSELVSTLTGPLRRWEAVLQMVIIPVSVMILFCSFAVILAFVRP